MTVDLHSVLSRLGLAQYINKFDDEGFETWETVQDITESDLDALGVKLGHRRILQREIASTRGISAERATSFSQQRPLSHGCEGPEDGNIADARSSTGTGGKRKYRRHPKPDEQAPERPPSAYVIFSNRVRGELKPENLSFTAIAKKVGERWQDLPTEEKEPYELEASSAKERYHTEMADYKTTKPYREYQQYLADFKAKNTSASEGKRPRLAKDDTTSSGSAHGEPLEVSTCPNPTTSGYPSPSSTVSGPPALRTAIASFIPLGTVSPMSTSPLTPSSCRKPSTGPPNRQITQPRPERTAAGPGHCLPVIPQFDTREAQQSSTPKIYQGPLETRVSYGRTTTPDLQQSSPCMPASIQQQSTLGTSSKSSKDSSLSNDSTTPSSVLSSVAGLDEGKRTALSLPPIAVVTTSGSSSGSTSYASRSSQSPFQASSGMKFESLQLPLPHNIAFGQHPLPRSEHEEKLANIFDLQDIPRESTHLKNMTLEQKHPACATPTDLSALPQPQHPPHKPALPTLDQSNGASSHENILPPNADPLSVLAYAGRLVGRGIHPSSSQ